MRELALVDRRGVPRGRAREARDRSGPPGCLGTIVVGIVGGLLGGVIFSAAGGEGIDDFSLYSILVAFVGATILLFGWGCSRASAEQRR